MTVIQARLVNTDHENNLLGTFPVGVYEDIPGIKWTYKRSDVGSASWTIPQSHANLRRDQFGPLRTDFRIGVSSDNGVTWRTVHAGFCGPVGLDSDRDSIEVAGLDWTAWLEQPYKFAGYQTDPSTWTEADIIKYWVSPGDTQQDVITDLMASTWDGDPLNSVQLVPSYTGTGWTTAVYLTSIQLGDATTVLSKIKELGKLNEPRGFEFYTYWDKTIVFTAPRRVTEAQAATQCIAFFAPSFDNIHNIKWTNNGPDGISIVGMPPAFPAFAGFDTYGPSAVVYRDWWLQQSFGDLIRSQDLTDVATASKGQHARNPQKSITIVVQPEVIGNQEADVTWFFNNWCGSVVHVDSEEWFLPYHRIDAYYWITSMTFENDDTGNWQCTLELEQIY